MEDSTTMHKAYRLIEGELKGVAAIQRDGTLPFEEKFIHCIKVYRSVRSRHPEAFDRVFVDLVLGCDGSTGTSFECRFHDGVVQPWREMLEQAVVRGEIRRVSTELLLNYLLSFLQGFISLSDAQREEWLEKGEIHTLLLEGLRKRT